jgi:tetratricopeptide (TPR) repeat protein
VKVIASLVSVTDGITLWTNVYERDAEDVFAVQAELSQAIVGAMRVSLAGNTSVPQAGTASVEAHDLVLRGRYLNDRYTELSVRQAIDLFRQALALDPKYADAWTGIADSWGRLSDDFVAPNEAAPHLRDALDHALALDPTSAKALAVRGLLQAFTERKYDAALQSLEQSVLRDSMDGFVGVYFGSILLVTAHRDSAVAAIRRALRLDPLARAPLAYAIELFRRAHADREADAACERLVELSPASLGCRTAFKLDSLRATRLLDSGSVASRAGRPMVARARLEAIAGRKADARRNLALAIVEAEASHRYFREEVYTKVYALLHDKDETMRWLQRAYDSNGAGIPAIPSDADFVFLDGDPRFVGLIRKIGLPLQR